MLRLTRTISLVIVSACGRFDFDAIDDAATTLDVSRGDVGTHDGPVGLISFVQVANNAVQGGTTVSATLPAVHAGHFLVAAIDFSPQTLVPTAVVDNRDNVYTLLGPFDGPTNPPNRQYLAYAFADDAGDVTCSVTVSGINDYLELRLHEYAGVSTSAPVDAVTGTGGVATGTDAAQVAITTAGPNELIFVLAVFEMAGSSGTQYTLRDGFQNDVTEDRQVPVANTYLATATMTTGTAWTVTALALRPR